MFSKFLNVMMYFLMPIYCIAPGGVYYDIYGTNTHYAIKLKKNVALFSAEDFSELTLSPLYI